MALGLLTMLEMLSVLGNVDQSSLIPKNLNRKKMMNLIVYLIF
jgi:hypothetical protein